MTLQDALEKLEQVGAIRSRLLDGMQALPGPVRITCAKYAGWVDGSPFGSGEVWRWEDGGRVLCGRQVVTGTHAWKRPTTPDTNDPLTVQGLLLLAREAWGDPLLHVVPYYGGQWWSLYSGNATHDGRHPTEPAAIEAAIIAAAERVS